MERMSIHGSIIYYYGNLAGYLEGERAVLDPLFEKEDLYSYLREKGVARIETAESVFDRLSDHRETGYGMEPEKYDRKILKIYQLKEGSSLMKRFIGLKEREQRGYGCPQKEEYDLVYEGETSDNDLETIWDKFHENPPKGFTGHPLSISDVVEVHDQEGCRSFYIDRVCFREIAFSGGRK